MVLVGALTQPAPFCPNASGSGVVQAMNTLRGNKRAQRRAEKRLANARERLALFSSTRSLGFWRWNRAIDEVWASKHARRILGLEARKPLTRDLLLATVHPEDRDRIVRAIGATKSHSDTVEMELRIVRQDMQIHWITAKVCAYRDANEMILRVVGYVVDESKGQRADAQFLKQQQQITHLTRVAMLGELSGAIAHELQQPLTAVLCNAQAAQLLAASPDFKVEDLREILSDIVNDNKHAGQVIQRLRSLLMRGELQLQRVEIGDLVAKVLALCRGILTERRVQVDLRIDAGIPRVLGDRVELQQVLLNLILNASESMSNNEPPDRRIEIDVTYDAELGAVHTSVLDCGKGIKEDQLEHIFEPFFTTKASGLGLGLAVSQSIVVAHKGRLWATKRAGPGTAFHFTLPIAAEPAIHGRCSAHSCDGERSEAAHE
jgi:C4-dicarboxylate-specific signal transduction histidine kinase